jgi:hypothetical protein
MCFTILSDKELLTAYNKYSLLPDKYSYAIHDIIIANQIEVELLKRGLPL